jgi:formylglycine-generating enzyme required for sulfatase activity
MIETKIGTTSAVGIFPSGHAECGAADLAGNVWEWCSTQWTSDYEEYEITVSDDLSGGDRRVLRGGAFYGDLAEVLVQCAHRDSDLPGNRNPFTGFRVATPTN